MPRRKRLTRSEAAAETRARLIAAAREVFVRRGYEAASIYEIAETAGYTIGALYSHFGGKPGVFLALVDDHFAAQLREVSSRLSSAGDAEASVAIGGEFWTEFLERDPELVVLFIEFWSASMRDEEVRARLVGSYRRLRSALAELIEKTAEAAGVVLPVPATEVAIVLDSLIDGFALHKLADREIPDELISRALSWLLSGMIGEVSAQSRRRRG